MERQLLWWPPIRARRLLLVLDTSIIEELGSSELKLNHCVGTNRVVSLLLNARVAKLDQNYCAAGWLALAKLLAYYSIPCLHSGQPVDARHRGSARLRYQTN